MKKLFLSIFISALFTLPADAQAVGTNKLPKEVNTTFKAKFPVATNVTWQKINKVNYQANFRSNGCDKKATFNSAGSWMQTLTTIKEQALPTSIRFALKKQYNGYTVGAIQRLESPTDGTTFKTELKKANQKASVIFTSNGKVVNYDDSSFAGL